MELKSKREVEIFAAGTWNGESYSVEDLDQMVKAFNETSSVFKPHLKLGHDDGQELLQRDGYPAAGWVDRVYRVGSKLFADFVDIPSKIFELIENKAYRKVSSEIYWNIVVNEKKYPYLLGAVSLLGADTPAVTSLNDILAWYKQNSESLKVYTEIEKDNTLKKYDFLNKDFKGVKSMERTEKEIALENEAKELKLKLEALETEKKEFALKKEDEQKAFDALKAEKEAADKKIFELEKASQEKEVKSFVDGLVTEGLITNACKKYVSALLGEEKKEYSVKEKDAEKNYSKFDLVKQILTLNSVQDSVNFDENSEDGEKEKANEDVLLEKANKYAKEKGVSFKEALKAVHKENA